MRTLFLAVAATAAAAVPLVTGTGTASAERHCYTLGVPGFDTYEVCHYLPIDPSPASAHGTVQAAPPIGPLPDPTDCHSMNRFLHIDNVQSCDGPPTE